MHQFVRWPEKWWQKPLVDFQGRPLPAELAVLFLELKPSEKGVWINSRGLHSGASDLIKSTDPAKTYETVRTSLPDFVGQAISEVFEAADVMRGCPDLVIWNVQTWLVRFVEVKCPHWDAPTPEQDIFLEVSNAKGFKGKIAEWEFQEQCSD
jgi:hypothetical protein